MNQQGDGGAYRAAIEAAMDELDLISRESERLRNRQHQLDALVKVLEPLSGAGERTVVEDRRYASDSIDAALEPVHADESILQPTEIALPQFFSQKKSESADPIQRRIDSILGLAVA